MDRALLRYPTELMDLVELADGRRVLIRPVVPRDADLFQHFVCALSDISRRNRFHGPISELPGKLLVELTSVDYRDHLAILAEVFDGSDEVIIGEARYVRQDSECVAEFAIAVADPWQRRGLGTLLLDRLEGSARRQGIERLFGSVLAANTAMTLFAINSGFQVDESGGSYSVPMVYKQLADGWPS